MCVCLCACLCKCVQVYMCAFACIGQRTTLAIISQQQPTVVFWCRVFPRYAFSSLHKLRGLANSPKDLSVSTYPVALRLWAHACALSFVLACLSTMGFKESNSGPHADETLYQELSPQPREVSKGQIVRGHAPSLAQPARVGIWACTLVPRSQEELQLLHKGPRFEESLS